ncbi:hypothetical protein ACJONO_05230, partial [Mycoplasmopsis synoviae]
NLTVGYQRVALSTVKSVNVMLLYVRLTFLNLSAPSFLVNCSESFSQLLSVANHCCSFVLFATSCFALVTPAPSV